QNDGADSVGVVSAMGHARLMATGSLFGVDVYWGTTNAGTNVLQWSNRVSMGVFSNVVLTNLSQLFGDLQSETTYYFTFSATNCATASWSAVDRFLTDTAPLSFSNRMKITFCGYNKPATLTNFPALVSLGTHRAGFDYARFASPAGNDLRFFDGTGSFELDYEIDIWNTNGESLIWVKVPRLVDSNTCIYAYWGQPALAGAVEAYTTNGATWSEGYEGVWHMSQTNPLDSSPFQRHGLATGAPEVRTNGIGRSLWFDNANDFIRIPGYRGITGADPRSMSVWINNNQNEDDAILSWGQNVARRKWVYRTHTDGRLRVEVNGGNVRSQPGWTDGLWHHGAFVWSDDGTPDINDGLHYVDGTFSRQGGTAEPVDTASDQEVRIGSDAF
ncbi:MAG: DUF2341 domain-containing protein, partial [Verrucomicrobiota bacterium]